MEATPTLRDKKRQPLSNRNGRSADAWRGKSTSKFPICFVKRNGALNCAVAIQNPNLAGAKARAALCVADCVLLAQKHRLNTWRFEALPAVSEWSDFDTRNKKPPCGELVTADCLKYALLCCGGRSL